MSPAKAETTVRAVLINARATDDARMRTEIRQARIGWSPLRKRPTRRSRMTGLTPPHCEGTRHRRELNAYYYSPLDDWAASGTGRVVPLPVDGGCTLVLA